MNTSSLSDAQAAEWADRLTQHPDYRVLRRLPQRDVFTPSETGRALQLGLVLDTETTGLDTRSCKVIELGILLFEFDPEWGTVHRVVKVFDELEDPGMPIPPETTAVHGITDEMVQGRHIDDSVVESMVSQATVVIAHHASFDRPFVEKRWPVFETKPWACSLKDIDWKAEGFGSAKLEYLLHTQGFFYDAHRAENDCWALLELLNRVLPQSQEPALLRLLTTLNQPQVRLYALGSPYESKDLLKARGYRWDAEKKAWHCTLTSRKNLPDEMDWLKRRVYGGRAATIEVENMGGTVRHSQRQGETSLMNL